MQGEQLLAEREDFEDEVLVGTEGANQATKEMPKPHDHCENRIAAQLANLVAKSLELRMYDVLRTHRTKKCAYRRQTTSWPETGFLTYRCRRHGDLDCVRRAPRGLATTQLQAMHSDLHRVVIHLRQKVVVVQIIALKFIIGRALDWVGVGAAASGDEVRYSAMLMALVIVDMPGEHDEAGVGLLLAGLEHMRERLFAGAGRVTAAVLLRVRRAGVRRMMHHDDDEGHVSRNRIELASYPLALRPGDFVEGAVEYQHQAVGNPDRVIAVLL